MRQIVPTTTTAIAYSQRNIARLANVPQPTLNRWIRLRQVSAPPVRIGLRDYYDEQAKGRVLEQIAYRQDLQRLEARSVR
jgi:hypothetical protein